MRVVFDCRSVFRSAGGIGRATACLARELGPALDELPGSHELLLLTGARPPAEPLARGPRVRELRVEAAMLDPRFEQVRLPGLLAELEADLYHGTCFAVPVASEGVARVATVHDVVFGRLPELVDLGLRRYLDRWTRASCQVADAVVTVSEFSKVEIGALYGCAAERIHVVPNAVGRRFHDAAPPRPEPGAEPPPPPGRGGEGARPYVLYVGSLEAKKNVPALLQAFAALVRLRPELPHTLQLAGGRGGQAFDLEAHLAELPDAVRARVEALGHVPDADLPGLYAGADAFCYLSEYEGYGLPPLEAMACGVPTVVAERASLPEVTAGAALLCDPRDPEGTAAALARALSERELRERLSREGRAVARRTSWARSARALAHLYQTLVPAAPVGATP